MNDQPATDKLPIYRAGILTLVGHLTKEGVVTGYCLSGERFYQTFDRKSDALRTLFEMACTEEMREAGIPLKAAEEQAVSEEWTKKRATSSNISAG